MPLMPLPENSGFEVSREIRGLLHLRFPNGGPLPGHEIVPTLHELAEPEIQRSGGHNSDEAFARVIAVAWNTFDVS